MDNSSVYHRSELEPEYAAEFARTAPECPWILDTDDEGQSYYTTEDKACTAQREYRTRHGFDPITGE